MAGRERILTVGDAQQGAKDPVRFNEQVVSRLAYLQGVADQLSPDGPGARGGSVVPVSASAQQSISVPSAGLAVGVFVNIADGVARRADRRTRRATHVVGAITSGRAVLYAGYADGPILVASGAGGDGKTIWLGEDGQATLSPPSLGTGILWEQCLGMVSSAKPSGLTSGTVQLDPLPRKV